MRFMILVEVLPGRNRLTWMMVNDSQGEVGETPVCPCLPIGASSNSGHHQTTHSGPFRALDTSVLKPNPVPLGPYRNAISSSCGLSCRH
jgi:hypothetical protein